MANKADIYRGLISYVQAVDPSIPMIIRGIPPPQLNGVDDFIVFDILSMVDGAARRTTVETYIDVQLIMYSVHAQYRADKQFDAIYRLLDKYEQIFDRKDIVIKNTCIQFKENKIIPLDLKSTGDFAKEILNNIPTLNLMSMVLLNQGIISTSKEG